MSPAVRSSILLSLGLGLVLVLLVLPVGGGRAAAQGDGTGSAAPAAGLPQGGGAASYHSPMRTACEDELAKDKDWFSNLQGRLLDKIERDVHKDAANYATANNKHVVAAYAAFWVLTAVFVVLMWRRQRALQAELARLEAELAKALGGGAA